jgi:AbiV family abortive infection protein
MLLNLACLQARQGHSGVKYIRAGHIRMWLGRPVAYTSFPMPSADQLRLLAAAAEGNAADLAADARLLLEAGRPARAHALATLALEELGKRALCLGALAGKLDERGFREAWSSHRAKLERSHLLAILSANSVERIFAWYEDDASMKMRGLYVDANPVDADGPPLTPSDVDPVAAQGIVDTAEAAVAGLRARSTPD